MPLPKPPAPPADAPPESGASGMRPGSQRTPTSREVARLAGVSQATVSRVLHGHPGVRGDTRERVQQALAQVDYQPNLMARAMKTARSGSIGVVVARLSNPLYPALLQEIGTALHRQDLRMMVWDAEHGGERPAGVALRQGLIDGIVVTTATEQSALPREAAASGAPVVLVNRTLDDVHCDQVSSDNLDGGRQIARYLTGAGRRRIAMISGPPEASTIRDRARGFREALAAAGVELPSRYIEHVEMFSHAAGRDAVLRLLELSQPPDAVFCANDVIALGAIDGARSRGMRVPDDLWIVGYDDIEMAGWGAYDLTTVRQPLSEMATLATALLVRRISGAAEAPAVHCLPNELVIRGSTAHARPKEP